VAKSTLSVSVDSRIVNILNSWANKSQIVDWILTNALQSEEGITELIEDSKITLERLERLRDKIRDKQRKQFENISPELKSELIGGRLDGNRGVKSILEKSPGKLVLWTSIINRKYNMALSPSQLQDLIKRLSDDR